MKVFRLALPCVLFPLIIGCKQESPDVPQIEQNDNITYFDQLNEQMAERVRKKLVIQQTLSQLYLS